MALLIDLFGYLSIVLHGLTTTAQSMTLGAVLFLALLGRPLSPRLGTAAGPILHGTVRIAVWSALALIVLEATTVALQVAVLAGTVDLPVGTILGANFAVSGLVKTSAAALILLMLLWRGPRAPVSVLLGLVLIELAAATLTTHAAARLDHRGPLLAVAFLHQFGAAIWIGGIPCFLLALARVGASTERTGWVSAAGGASAGGAHDGCTLGGAPRDLPAYDRPAHDQAVCAGVGSRVIGARFSRMSMAVVACIVLSGIVMSVAYIGDWQGLRHRLWRHGVRQDRDAADAAWLGRNELPAGRAATHATRHQYYPVAPLRRGRDRHRHHNLLCCCFAHLGATRGGPAAGPGELAGNRRAQHAAMVTS